MYTDNIPDRQERSLVVTNITLSLISCWFSFVFVFLDNFKTERLQVMWFFVTFNANFYKLIGRICSFFSTAIKELMLPPIFSPRRTHHSDDALFKVNISTVSLLPMRPVPFKWFILV